MKLKLSRMGCLALAAFCLTFVLPAYEVRADNGGSADYAMLSPYWPCADARAAEKDLPVLRKAVLWNTFGTDTTCLSQYLSDPRLKIFELHLINEPCVRNNRCGDYEFLHGVSIKQYDNKLVKRDPEFMAKLESYFSVPAEYLKKNLGPQTTCYVSPGVESNVGPGAAKVLIEEVAKFFPQCKAVWNPVNNRAFVGRIEGSVFELHSDGVTLTPTCINDLDGQDISFPTRPAILPQFISSIDIPAYFRKYAQCDAAFLWIAEFNGITKGNFVDPRQRKAFPNPATFALVDALLLQNQSK